MLELDKLMGARTNTHYFLESTCMGYMKLPAFTADPNLAADEYRISGSSRYSAGPTGYMHVHALPGTNKIWRTDADLWDTRLVASRSSSSIGKVLRRV